MLQTIGRVIRMVLVVAPILGIGIMLGIGWSGPQPKRPRPMETHIPAPVLETVQPPAQTAPPAEEDEETAKKAPKSFFSITGGDRARVSLETTRLPLAQAMAHYDRKNRGDGWQLNSRITRRLEGTEKDTIFLVYQKGGVMRMVIIGAPVNPEGTLRPVSVFDNTLRATAGRAGRKEDR